MHISEGVLSAPVLLAGVVVTVTGLAIGLKKMDYDRIPQVGILSATFFVASLIHIPLGPASIHLIMNGICGLLLGWMAFPAIFIGLALQAILFQFGGLTTLGVNTANMAFPAIVCFYLFNRGVNHRNRVIYLGSAALCGFVSILLGSIMVAFSLIFTGDAFLTVAKLLVLSHVPVMLIEGVLTAFCVGFLKKVKPELLEVPYANRVSSTQHER
ncbi:MAG: cobalt transporter CbiM [Pseudomonadota bacterium]